MQLSRNLKKILLVGSTILMFASVGAGTGNLTANARRRYRPQITRRYHVRHYRRRATRRYRHHATCKHRRARRFKVPSIKERAESNTIHDRKEDEKEYKNSHRYSPRYNVQQSKDAIKQINNYRTERGLEPYHEDKQLNNIAMLRAKNIATHKEPCDHYDKKTHSWYADEDAYKLGYIKSPTEDSFDENLAAGFTNSKGANNDFMYHDGQEHGHQDNILGKIPGEGINYVGAGYYNGCLVEEFTYSNDLEYNYDH